MAKSKPKSKNASYTGRPELKVRLQYAHSFFPTPVAELGLQFTANQLAVDWGLSSLAQELSVPNGRSVIHFEGDLHEHLWRVRSFNYVGTRVIHLDTTLSYVPSSTLGPEDRVFEVPISLLKKYGVA
jgi:hypothetical protein